VFFAFGVPSTSEHIPVDGNASIPENIESILFCRCACVRDKMYKIVIFAHRIVPDVSRRPGPMCGSFSDFSLMDSAKLLNLPGQRFGAHFVLTHFC
jgi:hypothetical protein